MLGGRLTYDFGTGVMPPKNERTIVTKNPDDDCAFHANVMLRDNNRGLIHPVKSERAEDLCDTSLPAWFLFQAVTHLRPDNRGTCDKTLYRKNIAQIIVFYTALVGSIVRTENSYTAGFLNRYFFFFDTELFTIRSSWIEPEQDLCIRSSRALKNALFSQLYLDKSTEIDILLCVSHGASIPLYIRRRRNS
jgi:hypothetical protein